MALNERNFYCFCGIWVYMIIIVAAIPANRRAIIVDQSDPSANVTQNNSVCWAGDVAYNNEDPVPGSGPCEQCVCNVPDIVCSAIKCEMKTGCKIIQKEDQCCPDFKCDCEYQNRTYYNGEKIDTTDTPCRVCYCKGGDVMCSTVGCYERDDCEGKMVPGTCCPKYDHCPSLDENNKNVKITQIKTDTMAPRAGGRGLQPWPLSSDSANVTVHPSVVAHGSTSRPELTIIMQRINPNSPLSNESSITSEPVDSASTFQDAAREALNTVRVATQPATPPADANQDLESTRAEPDLPANGSRCAHITPAAHSDLVSAIFANTEITEKAPESAPSSTPPTSDSVKPLVDMEKSTMAILQQLLDVKTTIEPLTAETNEALVAETIEPISAATIEQIAAKIAESIATTIEPADVFTQTHDGPSHLSLLNLLGNDLTVRASVLQSENASRHASVDDEDLEIANVSMVEMQSKSAVTSDNATTDAATENAAVELVEKGADDGPADVTVQESSNGTVEVVVTATADVTVVDDPNGTSTTASPAIPTNSTSSDVTEVAQVVLVERNSSPATAWEELGTVLAHVTVSYKEENKVDSDLNSSPFVENFATEATIGRSNSSEAVSSPTTDVTNASTTSDPGEVVLDGDEKGGQIVESGAAEAAESSTAATSTAVSTSGDERTELNALVFNFSQPESAETTSPASSGLAQATTKSDQASNEIRTDRIEFTTIEGDTSGEESEEANSTGSWSALTSSSTESTAPTRPENGGAAATYAADNGYNLTTEVAKVEPAVGTKLAANRSAANEQLPSETAVVSTSKDQGDPTNASTELPTSSASSTVRSDSAAEVTKISEFAANDTTTVPSNYVETVTFNNQIRLDVADQLPQSFFVESFLSPLNYSAPPSDTYPSSNDFPFEIFFNTNYSDSTSSSPFNFSAPAANFSDLFDVSSANASGGPLADNSSDGSNYTKIFAQKVVVHPVKVLNSVNSVYLSPGLGLRDGSSARPSTANSAESAPKANGAEGATKANSVEGATKANSIESATKANSAEGATKANFVEGATKANSAENATKVNSAEGATKANFVEGTTKANSAEGTTKANSAEGTTKANSAEGATKANFVEGTTKANSAEGTTKANSAEGATKANFVAGATKANSTDSATKVTADDNSTDTWNSTDGTPPYEVTTVAFEDTKPAGDNLWRNVSLSNYKILLDSLTDAKVRPFTKVPKVTGAPLTWLKNPGFLASSVANFSGAYAANAHLNASATDASSNTTASDQRLKNESRSEPQAKVYDPLMPYPEEYPEEYQTIQNGPAIIITRTTYTRIPDVTYTTVTMATLPTYQQVQKAEDGFAQTLFERKFRERSFSKVENSASDSSTESTRYFSIDVKKIEDGLPKRNASKGKSSDRRMPDPPLDSRNYIKSRISVKSVYAKDSKIPALDEKDSKIVQNFMNKHLRLR